MYIYDKNLEMIQPLVQELQHFLCFRFWPPGGQAKNQIGLKFGLYSHLTYGYICTEFQVNSHSSYEMCPANGRHSLNCISIQTRDTIC
jgi:hypothetical protein